jgi:glyoxylase-like metal-dependent hydrolase (beta-lactamase superfamily II)
MGDPTVDALYAQVRGVLPAAVEEVSDQLLPVAPGIRMLALRTPTLPPAAHTSTYVVGPEQGRQLVVDPGSPYPDQQERLQRVLEAERQAGRPIGLIALTHHHGDHVGGAAVLASRWNVPIAAHRRTAERLAGIVEVTEELGDEQTLREYDVTCVLTPGHADGHLCFEHGDASIVGDMVAGVGWILIDPVEGDMADYFASLARLLARRPMHLLPAHGPTIPDGPAKLREYIAHRTSREMRVHDALARHADASLEELLPDAYADTPQILWPLAERSLRAHVDKLVKEGRVSEVGPGRWTCSQTPL